MSGLSGRPQRIIVKLGTNLLTAGGDRLHTPTLESLVAQLASVRKGGTQVAVVTSGAVAAGRARVGAPAQTRSIGARQALAAIGQAHLVERYDALLQRHQLTAAQALLTRSDVSQRRGYLNVRNTILRLLEYGVVPIVNENDVVADEELRGGAFGENDALSALLANLIDADLLLLLSDVDGVYDRDPRLDASARVLPLLAHGSAEMTAALAASGPVGASGRGGMRAKLEAAQRAASSGTTVVVANGREADVITRIASGESLGTKIPARSGVRESRKRWLLSGLGGSGALELDEGASRAVREQGRSLLPAGVRAVRGEFARGDIVALIDSGGSQLAVGLSNYSSAEAERIRGRRSSEIAAELGYDYGSELVHRNNLALTEPSAARATSGKLR